jgi:hypothetical protein
MSLITIELRPYTAPSPPADWSLVPVLGAAWAALVNAFRLILSALVWVLVFVPLRLPLGSVVGYLLWRWRRRRERLGMASVSPTQSG